jgi:hypothetical protein
MKCLILPLLVFVLSGVLRAEKPAALKVMFLGLEAKAVTNEYIQSATQALSDRLAMNLDLKLGTPEEVDAIYAHEWISGPLDGFAKSDSLARRTGYQIFIGGAIREAREEVKRVGLLTPWAYLLYTWEVSFYVVDGAAGKKLYQGSRIFQARTQARWLLYGRGNHPFPALAPEKTQAQQDVIRQVTDYFGEISNASLQGLIKKTSTTTPEAPVTAPPPDIENADTNSAEIPVSPEPAPEAAPAQVRPEPEVSKDGKLIPPRFPKTGGKTKKSSAAESGKDSASAPAPAAKP